MLKAIHAFTIINILEVTTDLPYIKRLSEAIKVMDYDEQVFIAFTNLFDNKEMCAIMIKWIDVRF
jgi:hypothetical protein